MKLLDKVKLVIYIIILIAVFASLYEVGTAVDPTVYPVAPTLLWQFGYTLVSILFTPSSIMIWVAIGVAIANWELSARPKKETKSETIERLANQVKDQNMQLNYQDSRLKKQTSEMIILKGKLKYFEEKSK